MAAPGTVPAVALRAAPARVQSRRRDLGRTSSSFERGPTTILINDALVVADPLAVAEVAAPSTPRNDAVLKLTPSFRNPSITRTLSVMPDERSVLSNRRGEDDAIEITIHARGALRLHPPGLDPGLAELFPSPAFVRA